MNQSFRNPNYQAFVLVFAPGSPHSIAEYTVEQEVAPQVRHLERTNGLVVAELERLRDRLGLDYRVSLPTDHRDMNWWNGSRVVNIGA